MSLRLASSAENSTSSQWRRPNRTISRICVSASILVVRSLYFRCKSEVARNTCTRGFAAGSSARNAASTSSCFARASAATRHSLISLATARTASRSPGDAIGNPASITSTPNCSSCRASLSFSSRFIENPGDCSPSRSVVSNIFTISMSAPTTAISLHMSEARHPYSRPIYISCVYNKPCLCSSLLSLHVGRENSENPVDLAALHVFQTVANEQSFSRAAEKLYRTQPAVSNSVRKLEDWVGQPLFVRGSGARTLTDAGALLLEYANRMLNLREEIHKGMQQLNGLERGQVAIGVNESSIHALLPALEQYRNLHPGVQIRVHRVFSKDVPREVLNHHLDIGVISYVPDER